jgi:hypothetical protein
MVRPTRYRHPTLALAALALALVPNPAHADRPADWSFDVLHLKNGTALNGLIVGETDSAVQFQNVRRQPGRPTVVFFTTLRKSEIDHCDRLDDKGRELLSDRLKELDPHGEKSRMERIDLKPAAWGKNPTGALRYESDHFSLTSNAPEDVVRRAAVRLELIYAAYTRFLPPRHKAGSPTEIILVQSLDEYQTLLRADGRMFLNPAFYDPAANRVVCASDLERLGRELEAIRQQHTALLAELDRIQAGFVKLLKGKELEQRLEPLRETRLRIARVNKENDALFDRATRQLFGSLYHESFHAYVASFVYPPVAKGGTELPRWLNEGLAQVFETAIVEAGDLRAGHAERDRLLRAKKRGELVPVGDLLRSGPGDFLIVHAGDRPGSDRAYLTAWALAFYLTFDRQLLGTPALDQYLKRLADGADKVTAFEELVGQPLAKFESEFQLYVRRLQPDGTLAETVLNK